MFAVHFTGLVSLPLAYVFVAKGKTPSTNRVGRKFTAAYERMCCNDVSLEVEVLESQVVSFQCANIL